jgi:Flp pilus assembly protein TadG
MTRLKRHGDQGSLVVELVVLTPVLFAFALCALVFGRVTEARQQITASSRAAAQAAAVMPTAQSAVAAASANGVIGHYGPGQTCAQSSVVTDIANFRPGGTVTVTVTCRVHLSDLSFPGIPGSTSISVSTVAPVDPYRSVQ